MNDILDFEMALLRIKVDAELADPKFANRTHGTRSCYNRAKCKGPLCTYIMRRNRRKADTVTVTRKEFDDYLEERLKQHHADQAGRLANRRRS